MRKIIFLFILLINFSNLYSGNPNKGVKKDAAPTSAAGCSNAVASANLQLNNVRARIDGTGGALWLDRAGGFSAYEVPKRNNVDDPKYTSIYSGALWMGGTDVNGQIKIAGVTFRSGNDFWPGPLDPTTAEVSSAECSVFDQYWGVSRSQVNEFVAHYECTQDPNCDVSLEFSGYQIPDVIREWPAKGNVVQKGGAGPTYDVTEHLAPFFDRDGDDFYDPDAGDYPKYDLIGDIDCRTTRDLRLFGDTTIWFVFNDKGNVHTET
ncbi:MAG: T9SS C-terminal target domain-containing protein, partial [Flavobacteriales bacterium]